MTSHVNDNNIVLTVSTRIANVHQKYFKYYKFSVFPEIQFSLINSGFLSAVDLAFSIQYNVSTDIFQPKTLHCMS